MSGSRWRAVMREVWQVLLPVHCAACETPGAVLCPACRAHFAGPATERRVAGLRVRSAAEWDERTAAAMRVLKRDGSPALARALGGALRAAVAEVRPTDGVIALVPVPSTRAAFRRRGFRPVEMLLRGAGLPWVSMLVVRRGIGDQRRLGKGERERNMAGAFRARSVLPRGTRGVILVDDVVTTGATMHAAHEALASVGIPVLGAVSVLSTPRRKSQRNDR